MARNGIVSGERIGMIEHPNKIWIWLAAGYLFILGVSMAVLSVPPDKLPFYAFLTALGIGVFWTGRKIYRWIGALFVVIAVLLVMGEVKRGNTLREAVEKVLGQ